MHWGEWVSNHFCMDNVIKVLGYGTFMPCSVYQSLFCYCWTKADFKRISLFGWWLQRGKSPSWQRVMTTIEQGWQRGRKMRTWVIKWKNEAESKQETNQDYKHSNPSPGDKHPSRSFHILEMIQLPPTGQSTEITTCLNVTWVDRTSSLKPAYWGKGKFAFPLNFSVREYVCVEERT